MAPKKQEPKAAASKPAGNSGGDAAADAASQTKKMKLAWSLPDPASSALEAGKLAETFVRKELPNMMKDNNCKLPQCCGPLVAGGHFTCSIHV